MFEIEITPGFYETDALGHINNTVLPMWFEKARLPLFRIFTPDLDPKKWALIVVKLEVDFLAQMNYVDPVTIKTGVERIGNSSFVIAQSSWQNGIITAQGRTTLVRYCYDTQRSTPLEEPVRAQLMQHLVTDEKSTDEESAPKS